MEKVRNNWFQALAAVFKKLAEPGETEYLDGVPEYKPSDSLRKLEKNTDAPLLSETDKKDNKAGKSGGLKKKYETPTIEVKNMSSENLEKMKEKLESQRTTNNEEKEIVE